MAKICILSDNRTGINWGARATSISLSQILNLKNDIVGVIYNDLKKNNIVLYYKLLGLIKINSPKENSSSKAFTLFMKILLKLKILKPIYFIGSDINRNIKYFNKYKKSNKDLNYIQDQIHEAEYIVVNGEGDMIFNYKRNTLFFLLTIMEIAFQQGKKITFVNAMVSESPTKTKFPEKNLNLKNKCIDILAKCENIQLRDSLSQELLNNISTGIKSSVLPDALFSWLRYYDELDITCADVVLPIKSEKKFGAFDFKEPYICVSGSSIAPLLDRHELINNFIKLVEKLKCLDKRIYLVIPCTGDLFLEEVGRKTNTDVIHAETSILFGMKILANSELYISGRYHPSIMASLGGTPLICMDSNSHKMPGLQKLLNYGKITEFKLPLSNNNIEKIYSLGEEYIGNKKLISSIKDTVNGFNDNLANSINKPYITSK
ncbi:polysaccharide pyruvyl transferase family protein [Saccharicrinis aurantiacus]|uniref:polysaccharide pyruvyl transferase family protein n=1 Tax=Saccharicrinis aurantiacus TaxID=1849719 RepID=UPI000837E588|nr:polysaccharide pyruvyl transferase family protein [Saccharicrinis aurantiacus]